MVQWNLRGSGRGATAGDAAAAAASDAAELGAAPDPLSGPNTLASLRQSSGESAPPPPRSSRPRRPSHPAGWPAAFINLMSIADDEDAEVDVEEAFEDVISDQADAALRGALAAEDALQPPQLFALQNLPMIARADSELSVLTSNADHDEVRFSSWVGAVAFSSWVQVLGAWGAVEGGR